MSGRGGEVRLEERDRALLSGAEGEAARLAMRILSRMAAVRGARELLDIEGAHIDATIYVGDAGLEFAERLAGLGARVRVPSTLNVSGLDELHWREWAVPEEWAEKAARQMRAYASMGTTPTWTCAPYQTAHAPRFGQQIAWGESNAVVFANSVIGARTERYPDLLDICCAITGRAPAAGLHLDQNRLATRVLRLTGIPESLAAADDFYPVLGHLLGRWAEDEPAVITGLPGTPDPGTDQGTPGPRMSGHGTSERGTPEHGTSERGTPERGTPGRGTPERGTSEHGTSDRGASDQRTPGRGTPSEDQLKALGAAAASSGAVALFHIPGVTPEAPTLAAALGGREPELIREVGLSELREAREQLTTRAGGPLELVALGSPHFSFAEFEKLAATLRERLPGPESRAKCGFLVTTSRAVRDLADRAGLLEPLRAFGGRITVDTCILATPMLPGTTRRLMTNSAKYAWYAPSLLGAEVAFGSLAECVESARRGRVVRENGPWDG